MGSWRKYWPLYLAAGGVVYWFFTGSTPMMVIAALVGRGRRLDVHLQDSDGNDLRTLDEHLAIAAENLGEAIDPDAYLLGSVSASEHWAAGEKEKALMQRIVMNEAAATGNSIEQTVTGGKGLGTQPGRYCSTVNGPWEDDYRIAQRNLAGTQPDDSQGSKHWVHKYGFTSVNGYDDLCASWFASMGIVPVDIGGVSSCRIFLPKSQVQS